MTTFEALLDLAQVLVERPAEVGEAFVVGRVEGVADDHVGRRKALIVRRNGGRRHPPRPGADNRAMIGRLTGIVAEKSPPQVLLDVQGVGYEVDVPMSTFCNLPALGERTSLLTHLVVREDAHQLFAFLTPEERGTFRQLIKISGIGPRTALAILSGLSVADLANAVTRQEGGRLQKVPGIGKKTAERLLLELKGKLGPELAPAGGRHPTRRPTSSRR
jgi:Holliday junction DNA helicase RuvA